MALDLSTSAVRTAVSLSSTFDYGYRGALCVDSSLDTLCATGANQANAGLNWVAVRVTPGTRVGTVAVHNRQDFASASDGTSGRAAARA